MSNKLILTVKGSNKSSYDGIVRVRGDMYENIKEIATKTRMNIRDTTNLLVEFALKNVEIKQED